MRRLAGLVILCLAVTVWPVQAQGPDDEYIAIYGLIQQGDTLGSSGQPAEALVKYTAAQSQLQSFQRTYSTWNTKVVNFRLTYLEAKIDAMKAGTAAAAAKPAQPTGGMAPLPPSAAEVQLKAVQEQIKDLQADRANLEAKLKEAFAAQPAAVDPRELAKAQERIESLLKENALLRVSMTNRSSGADAAAASQAMVELKQSMADASRKLAEQSDRADKLAAEKSDLQTRLDKMAAASTTSEASAKAMDDLKSALATQTERADKLASEKADLQSRVDNLASQTNLLAELVLVKKELEAANQQLAEQTSLATQRTQERDTLQGRVDTLLVSAAAAEALRAENEVLKQQAADAKVAATKAEEQGRQLVEAQTKSAALQSEVGILRLEKTALQDRIKQPPAPLKSRPEDIARIQQLERERDGLQKKLEAMSKKPVAPIAAKVGAASEKDLKAQVAVLRARVGVLEAKPVPYTQEELALFKKPRARPVVVMTQGGSNAKPVNALPPGTASLAAEAQRNYSARKYDAAEANYLEILRRDENNAYTLANLAAIQLEMGHLTEAQKHIEQAVAIAPDDGYNLAVMGYLKFRQEKYDEALDALSQAASINPENAEVQNYLGVTLSHKGQRVQAETALRRALQIDPSYGDAHNNLAVIYATQTPPLLELARWHYQKAQSAGLSQNAELEKMLKLH